MPDKTNRGKTKMTLYINKPMPCPACNETKVVITVDPTDNKVYLNCPYCMHNSTLHMGNSIIVGDSLIEVLYDRAADSLPRDSMGYRLRS